MTRRAVLMALGGSLFAGSLGYNIWKSRAGQTTILESPAVDACCGAVDHDGWLLTAADKARLTATDSVALLEDTNLPGGDIANGVVEDASACATWCLSNPECRSFTYAKANHPDAERRNRCWIKTAQPRAVSSPSYTSGLRSTWGR